jgi:hypothetical protein
VEELTENGLLVAGISVPSVAVIWKLLPPVPIVQPEKVTTPSTSLPMQPDKTPVPCVSVKMTGERSVIIGLIPSVVISTIGWVVKGLPA